MAQAVRSTQYGTAAPRLEPKVRQKRLVKRHVKFQPVLWSLSDVMHGVVALMLVGVALFAFVTMKNMIDQQQNVATTTAAKVEAVRDLNNTAKEQISSLTTQQRMNDIAAKNGLTMQNQNIKNVK
ncbi:MAG: hypothetical protein LBT80_04495 [Lactobacillaceae bacterium]|jgi:cell division protein FtsL|nr:hypothetical protein [Lactobacillaceae bacterium]